VHPSELETYINKHVGKRVRQLRTRLQLSQTALGAQLGVTFQQIQKYEKGTNRISAGKLFVMSKKLGVSVSWFYRELQLPE